VDPVAEGPELPAPAPAGRKSALAFFALLLLLFLPGLLAQSTHFVLGLLWSELFVFLLPALVVAAGSNLRPAVYLRLRPVRPSLLALGVLAGGAATLLAMGVMAAAQHVIPQRWLETFDVSKLFEGSSAERALVVLSATLVAPVCEEITFRGYLLTTLLARWRPAFAVAASALLFSLIHLDPVRFPALLVQGAVFGWLSWRAGSVWPAVAAHVANNGIVSAVALAAPDEMATAELPPAGAVLGALALGVLSLAPLLAAFRAAAPPPRSPEESMVLRDPGDPSTRFRFARVPTALHLAAFVGAQLLLALVLARQFGVFGEAP
jgi:membrane protease YdiL (CAAX protease family)